MMSHRIGIMLYLVAAFAYLVLIGWGPNSEPPFGLHQLLGFAMVMCVAGVISSFATPRAFTIMAFAAIGTTLGIGVLGIFGLGLYGLISPVVLVIGTWALRNRLDGGMAVPATVTCCISMVSPLLLMLV